MIMKGIIYKRQYLTETSGMIMRMIEIFKIFFQFSLIKKPEIKITAVRIYFITEITISRFSLKVLGYIPVKARTTIP